jgi:hypothetical protein
MMDVDSDTESEASASFVVGDAPTDRVNPMRRRSTAGKDSASQPEHSSSSSSSVRGEEQRSDRQANRPAKQACVEHRAQSGAQAMSVYALLSPTPCPGSHNELGDRSSAATTPITAGASVAPARAGSRYAGLAPPTAPSFTALTAAQQQQQQEQQQQQQQQAFRGLPPPAPPRRASADAAASCDGDWVHVQHPHTMSLPTTPSYGAGKQDPGRGISPTGMTGLPASHHAQFTLTQHPYTPLQYQYQHQNQPADSAMHRLPPIAGADHQRMSGGGFAGATTLPRPSVVQHVASPPSAGSAGYFSQRGHSLVSDCPCRAHFWPPQ